MKKLLVVMQFEFLHFVKSTTFLGVTLFLVLASLLGPLIPSIISFVGEEAMRNRSIAVVDIEGRIAPETFLNFIEIESVFYESKDDIQNIVLNGQHDFAVILERGGFTLYANFSSILLADIEYQLISLVRHQAILSEMISMGVEEERAMETVTFEPVVRVLALGQQNDDTLRAFNNPLGTLLTNLTSLLMLYLGITVVGQYMRTAIIREKTSKTIEILIISCKPWYLFNGKVFGVCLVALFQIALIVIVAPVATLLNSLLDFNIEDIYGTAFLPEDIFLFVTYFILALLCTHICMPCLLP